MLSALVGVGLVLAAAVVLVDGIETSAASADAPVPANAVRPEAEATRDDPAVRVRDPLLVVNKDGSAAVGAYLQNVKDVDVALMGVVVWVDGHRLPVNSTQMWLPVPAGDRSQVGAASDAGGFVLPSGISESARADVEFRFDDGTCVLADVAAVARTNKHRLIYPRSNRPIGPVTSDEPPPGSTSCNTEQDSTAEAQAEDELADATKRQAQEATRRHELLVTIRDQPAPGDPDAADAYEAESGNGCSAIVWGENSEQLGELIVIALDEKDEPSMRKTFSLPASARLLPDGTCEATMTIDVPYASRYMLGVGITGRGIAREDAPDAPVVITEGHSQSVVVEK
ncbi:MAG: hypothetical protein ABWX74_19380 [Aeromicrobium sp.]